MTSFQPFLFFSALASLAVAIFAIASRYHAFEAELYRLRQVRFEERILKRDHAPDMSDNGLAFQGRRMVIQYHGQIDFYYKKQFWTYMFFPQVEVGKEGDFVPPAWVLQECLYFLNYILEHDEQLWPSPTHRPGDTQIHVFKRSFMGDAIGVLAPLIEAQRLRRIERISVVILLVGSLAAIVVSFLPGQSM